MSNEDNERIERLEKTVSELVGFLPAIMRFFDDQRTIDADLTELYFSLSNENVALLRFIVSSSLVADERARQDFLRRVSRMESAAEKAEALLAKLEKLRKSFSPGAAPPDPPEPPGSPP
jgi:hypothetical protein